MIIILLLNQRPELTDSIYIRITGRRSSALRTVPVEEIVVGYVKAVFPAACVLLVYHKSRVVGGWVNVFQIVCMTALSATFWAQIGSNSHHTTIILTSSLSCTAYNEYNNMTI